jgi:ERCC4-type nuclease
MDIKKDIIYIDKNERNRIDEFKRYLDNPKRNRKEISRGDYKGYIDIITTGNHHLKYLDLHETFLNVGDVRWNDIAVEIKTNNDLSISVYGDHMDRQIDEALKDTSINHYYVFALSDDNGQINQNIRNYFYAKQSLKGVHFCIVDNLTDLFSTMCNLFRYSNSPAHIFTNNYRFQNKNDVTINPSLNMLLGLPSCTHNSTNKIFKKTMCFNVETPFEWSLNYLQSIVGKKTGENIYNELHGYKEA